MHEIDYKTISIVIETWEQLRRLDNYEEKAGMILFRRYELRVRAAQASHFCCSI